MQLNSSEPASPLQAMMDVEDKAMVHYELRDSEEENDDEPPAAKRSRLELINKSDDNKTLEIIMSCISTLENLKKQNDVKETTKSIERCRRFELLKSCRQRRTLNADGKNDVS